MSASSALEDIVPEPAISLNVVSKAAFVRCAIESWACCGHVCSPVKMDEDGIQSLPRTLLNHRSSVASETLIKHLSS